VWTLLDILSPRRIATSLSNIDPSVVSRLKPLSRNSLLLTALIFVTAASGAFVAGMDAGLVYNEFPLMGGKLIPSDIGALVPWWKNCFENATTVQFQHRLLATLTSLSIGLLYLQNRFMHKTSWTMLPPQVRLALNAMTIVVAIQYSLGITTLLNYVPTPLASAHQIGSLSLFTVAIYFLHVMKRIRL
jgi:cytochrome c oxidase assembly protein subunit 15